MDLRKGVFLIVEKETRRYLKELGYFSTIGLSVALAIFIGLAIGLWLDEKLGTHPWLMIIFLILGIIAGYRNIGLAIKKSRKF